MIILTTMVENDGFNLSMWAVLVVKNCQILVPPVTSITSIPPYSVINNVDFFSKEIIEKSNQTSIKFNPIIGPALILFVVPMGRTLKICLHGESVHLHILTALNYSIFLFQVKLLFNAEYLSIWVGKYHLSISKLK